MKDCHKRVTFLFSLLSVSSYILSQVSLVETNVTCSYDFSADDVSLYRYIVDSVFYSDTFMIKISNVQNCGFKRALHEYELSDNKLQIKNTLYKEEVDSTGMVTLFIGSAEECECLFIFTYKFIGLRNQVYEIIYNGNPIYFRDSIIRKEH